MYLSSAVQQPLKAHATALHEVRPDPIQRFCWNLPHWLKAAALLRAPLEALLPAGFTFTSEKDTKGEKRNTVERKDAWAGHNNTTTESPVHRAWEGSQVEFSLLCRTSTDVTGRM